MRRFSKAIAALLGTATPAGLVGIAAALGHDISTEVAVSVVSAAGALATYLAPANSDHPSMEGEESQELISPDTHPELFDEDTVEEYVGKHRSDDRCSDCPNNGCAGCPLRS